MPLVEAETHSRQVIPAGSLLRKNPPGVHLIQPGKDSCNPALVSLHFTLLSLHSAWGLLSHASDTHVKRRLSHHTDATAK
ncbi:hypothetical protein PGTUg99_026897 [Puccinia graminis f. sp. tritici]|uniref:Uncharacterized protein n=1 Tax=Puccinia graminis f. sp. tritici TaxID=56615 RepID=A0A5B0REH2_PUCGR|nr:hypothetical protein PGTUg99_026897 [Puccinia graminis f. sp. tritici]